jgi:hypothetical protein
MTRSPIQPWRLSARARSSATSTSAVSRLWPGGQDEGPAVGVHGQRPAARRYCALLQAGPRGVDAEPADVHAADAHAGREAVAMGLVVDVGGRQRTRHQDEEDAPGQERRANPKPAPRRETAALANRRAHAIRVPHRAGC